MFLAKYAERYVKDTGGNMAIMFALVMFAVLIGAGVAIDTSMAQKTKLRLQDTADAAVLAAAKSGETDPIKLKKVAQAYIDANSHGPSKPATSLTVTPSGQVQVSIKSTYDTQIVGIIGRPEIDLSVESAAPLGASEPVNVALVLDITGSMRGPKLDSLKSAATNLITKLETLDSKALKVSVVPFAQYVNVGTSTRDAEWIDLPHDSSSWQGCIGSRGAPWHERVDYSGKKFPGLFGVPCGTEILPLTNDLKAVKNQIQSFSAAGWTYIPSGLTWGWRSLMTSEPLTHAKGPYADNTRNVMVLMTDGANTKSKHGNHHTGNSIDNANQLTKKLCNKVKADDIEIYTIAYEINDVATKNLMRNCATSSAYYFDAKNSAQLNRAFNQIGANLIKVRLTH